MVGALPAKSLPLLNETTVTQQTPDWTHFAAHISRHRLIQRVGVDEFNFNL